MKLLFEELERPRVKVFWSIPVPAEVSKQVSVVRSRMAEHFGSKFHAPTIADHVTLLYMGFVLEDEVNEIIERGRALVADKVSKGVFCYLSFNGLKVFPVTPRSEGRNPLVLSVNGADQLNAVLLRGLADKVQIPQFVDFNGHVTLGYVEADAGFDAVSNAFKIASEHGDHGLYGFDASVIRVDAGERSVLIKAGGGKVQSRVS